MSTAVAEEYVVEGGVAFHHDTAPNVRKAILRCLKTEDERVRLDYGDPATGESFSEEENIEGYIGLSSGKLKVAMLWKDRRSIGPVLISTEKIVSMFTMDGQRLYRHPDYQPKYKWEEASIEMRDDPRFAKKFMFVVVAAETSTGFLRDVESFGTRGQAIRWLHRKQKFERV